MKKRRIPVVFLSCLGMCFFLTCCAKPGAALLSYDSFHEDMIYQSSKMVSSVTMPLLSSELCMIPKDYVQEINEKTPEITAGSALLTDETSHTVLYASNVYKKIYPASLTKLMTAYVTLQYGNLEDTVTFSKNAANLTVPLARKCGFKEGDSMNLKDLLTAFLIYSGNDAGIAIAEHISGSEEKFAQLMNQEAKKLGAVHSHFINSHGLHEDKHYTTMYDLYLIFHALIQNKDFLSIIALPQIDVVYLDANGVEQHKSFASTNQYLVGSVKAPSGITVIGGKSGTTNEAGNCLMIYCKDESEKGYITAVMKADTKDGLYTQLNKLLNLIPTEKASE